MNVIGTIKSAEFGLGGSQEAQLGLHLVVNFDGADYILTRTYWDSERIHNSEYTMWSEEDRSVSYDEIMRFLSKILNTVKVNYVSELKGKRVSILFSDNDGNLVTWNILKD